jgi:hypothetical protein
MVSPAFESRPSAGPASHVHLSREQRQILLRAARSEDGRFVIQGLGPVAMAGLASIVLSLQRAHLVNTNIHFRRSQQTNFIPVEITDAGRRALAAG